MFLLVLGVFGLGCTSGGICADLRMTFVDDWAFLAGRVVGNEKD